MHHRAKLTPEQVQQIRAAYRPGEFGYVRVSKQFNVPVSTVRDILTYRTRWKV